eukprot:907030-Rhodomonas_salina.8
MRLPGRGPHGRSSPRLRLLRHPPQPHVQRDPRLAQLDAAAVRAVLPALVPAGGIHRLVPTHPLAARTWDSGRAQCHARAAQSHPDPARRRRRGVGVQGGGQRAARRPLRGRRVAGGARGDEQSAGAADQRAHPGHHPRVGHGHVVRVRADPGREPLCGRGVLQRLDARGQLQHVPQRCALRQDVCPALHRPTGTTILRVRCAVSGADLCARAPRSPCDVRYRQRACCSQATIDLFHGTPLQPNTPYWIRVASDRPSLSRRKTPVLILAILLPGVRVLPMGRGRRRSADRVDSAIFLRGR